MNDIIIRKTGKAGHITLNRPAALNALTWDMCLAIEAAIDEWRSDSAIQLIIIDGAGDKAFCAGGDIAEMYASSQRQEYDYGQRFWRDEYRLNAKLARYPKPIVSFLHGFTMGGGVGVGCHASHRIVCDSSRIAMPECSIGLVPDVGGSLILANAPGRLGEYLGTTGARMGPADAIYAGFADCFIPEREWDTVKNDLINTGELTAIGAFDEHPGDGAIFANQVELNQHFSRSSMIEIGESLANSDFEFAKQALAALKRNAPLAMTVTLDIIRAVREQPDIRTALDHEFRYTYRCAEQGDFIEGIRAAIIDRDRNPRWRHQSWQEVPASEIAAMTAPLGDAALQWEDET
ncbi:enoyl-CoA hydratase/isomerase family protein [Loktanella agnita]|uniref:enoyl-CoA hydratase/isomerase family protein n=1 Tax=Loktanella agnita TaxID=287097 RepID=UPI003987CF01